MTEREIVWVVLWATFGVGCWWLGWGMAMLKLKDRVDKFVGEHTKDE